MRNTCESSLLSGKISTVWNMPIISKTLGYLVAFRVICPRLFTVTHSQYKLATLNMTAAIKFCPNYQ